MNPIPCTVPRCKEPSVFSTLGMIDYRYWPQCPDHAAEYAEHQKTEAVSAAASLAALLDARELPGQQALL